MNNYFAVVGLLNGITALMTAVYLFIKDKRNPIYVSYSIFTTTVALWQITYSIWQSQTEKYAALMMMRWTMFFCYFIIFAFFWFVLNITEFKNKEKYRIFCIVTPSLFAFLQLIAPNLLLPSVSPKMFFPFWPDPGILMHFYLVIFLIIQFYCFYLLIKAWIESTGMKRWQLKWISVPMIFAWLGGASNWFLWYNIPIPPVPNILVAVFFIVIAYAIIRRQLFDIDKLAEIVQELRLSAMGRLAATINHDLRNPLYIAKTKIESRLEEVQNSESKETVFLGSVLQQLDRAMEVVNRFKEMAKPIPKQWEKERVNLGEILQKAWHEAYYEQYDSNIQFKLNINEESIFANKRDMEETFFNLLLNACQAIGKRNGLIEASAHYENGRLAITISDDGPGISNINIKKIFEPFYTTKENSGTGLGLYIAKQMVERNGGRISVESREGKGTMFKLEFVRT